MIYQQTPLSPAPLPSCSSSTHRLAVVPRWVGLLVVGQAEGGVELWVEHAVVHQAIGFWVETLRVEGGGMEEGVRYRVRGGTEGSYLLRKENCYGDEPTVTMV